VKVLKEKVFLMVLDIKLDKKDTLYVVFFLVLLVTDVLVVVFIENKI